MGLDLFIWGPAFGLASINAECLAAAAYLAKTVPREDFCLVQTSPSAVPPHQLPALCETRPARDGESWIAGYDAIVAHVDRRYPSPSPHPPASPADMTAYATYLRAQAAPLLALSLYASPTNWAGLTRPAYGAILPPPLPWTEPPAVRAAMVRRAALLGGGTTMVHLLRHEEAEAESAARDPDRDRALFDADPVVAAVREGQQQRRAGWGMPLRTGLRRTIQAARRGVSSVSSSSSSSSVRDALGPERMARIRLEALAVDVLDVLDEVQWRWGGRAEMTEEEKAWGGSTSAATGRTASASAAAAATCTLVYPDTALRCLGFAHLALMLVPEAPRPWLRDVLRARYPALCAFVDAFRAECFPGGADAPEWRAGRVSGGQDYDSRERVALRFGRGLVRGTGLGALASGVWDALRWRFSSRLLDVLAGVGAGGALLGAAVGVFCYRRLPPFGAPVFTWVRAKHDDDDDDEWGLGSVVDDVISTIRSESWEQSW